MKQLAAVMALLLACGPVAAQSAVPAAPPAAAPLSEQAVIQQMMRDVEGVSKASRCRSDVAVTEAERAGVTAVGIDFLRMLNANDGAGVNALLTSEMKDQFAPASVRQMLTTLHQYGPYLNPRVSTLYVVDAREVADYAEVACADAQGHAAMVSVLKDPRQAHVVVELDDNDDRGWALTLWLIERDGRWQSNGFDVHNTRVGRMGAVEALEMARIERAAGHEAAAVVLYRSAIGTSNRGGHFILPALYSATNELEAWRPGVAGLDTLGFSWKDRATTWQAAELAAGYFDGKIWLRIVRAVSTWTTDAAAETDNQAMLASFRDTQMGGTTGVFDGFEVIAATADGKHVKVTRSTVTNTRGRV